MNIRNSILVGTFAVIGLGTVAGFASSAVFAAPWQEKHQEAKEAPEAPNSKLTAPVTVAKAAAAAVAKVPGYVNEAKLEKEGGKLIWDIDVIAKNHKVYGVDVDAKTGKVLTSGEEGEEKGEKEDGD